MRRLLNKFPTNKLTDGQPRFRAYFNLLVYTSGIQDRYYYFFFAFFSSIVDSLLAYT